MFIELCKYLRQLQSIINFKKEENAFSVIAEEFHEILKLNLNLEIFVLSIRQKFSFQGKFHNLRVFYGFMIPQTFLLV